MKFPIQNRLFCFLILAALTGCGRMQPSPSVIDHREDAAHQVEIDIPGSLQNPAWSPDSKELVFTRFRNGYNQGPADLLVVNLENLSVRTLVSDGSDNINLPGSAWNSATQHIIFSSSREPHDEVFTISEDGQPGEEIKVTSRTTQVAYEPSFSPDGQWVVFESHTLDKEGSGIITKFKIDGTEPYQTLTDADADCRQPNWSPAGDWIVYQAYDAGQWDIWIMLPDGTYKTQLTVGEGDKTDASFSPDGEWIVFSAESQTNGIANLFITPLSGGDAIQITDFQGYDGAPSWSPDGKRVAFESSPLDPDNNAGTTIWMIDLQGY